MNNPLNILPKQASFDLKSSKLRWRWGAYDAPPDPLIAMGIAPSPLAADYFVSIFRSQLPFSVPPLLNSWIRHWLIRKTITCMAKFQPLICRLYNILIRNRTMQRRLHPLIRVSLQT